MENSNIRGTHDRNRIIYFDVLRILASFFVVVLHISSSSWLDANIYTFEFQMVNIYEGIAIMGVPIFVMISGALFLGKDIPIKSLYSKYIFRLVLSFIVWSLGYFVVFYAFGKEQNNIEKLVFSFCKGHFHMWFIYMIIGLYMITPFLKRIVADEKLTRYFLIISFIFALLIPEIIRTIKVYNNDLGNRIEKIIDQAYLKFVLGYTFYYVLGYYISQKTISKKQRTLIYVIGVTGLLSTIIFTYLISTNTGKGNGTFLDALTVNVAFEALLVFVLIKTLFSGKKFSVKTSKRIGTLSKYSFGAYLVHIFVIKVLERFGLTAMSFNTFISVPVISVVVCFLSYIISAVLNHIPFVKKYLV